MKIYSVKLLPFLIIFFFVIMACSHANRYNSDEEKAKYPNDTVKNYNPPSQVYKGGDSLVKDTVRSDTGYRR